MIDTPRASARETRIPPAVGVLLDAAHAEVLAAERALQVARLGLERLVRVHLASTGVDAAGRRVDRDQEGWFHAALDGRQPPPREAGVPPAGPDAQER